MLKIIIINKKTKKILKKKKMPELKSEELFTKDYRPTKKKGHSPKIVI
jgi:hypothetical protein